MSQKYVTRSVKRKLVENNESKKGIKRRFKADECSICMETIETVVSLDTCLHEFCLLCLCKWLSVHKFCPNCKQVPNNLLYQTDTDNFLLSVSLNDFNPIWNKTNFIMDIFSIKQHKVNKLIFNFQFFLRKLNYYSPVIQRKIFYFCDMKTILPKLSKLKWDPDLTYFKANHIIWEWLTIELSVFYPQSFIDKQIQHLKYGVPNYETLKKKLSNILSQPIFSKFLSEMETFLSYFHSIGRYYKNCFVIAKARVPGNLLQSVIIENQSVNVWLLAKIMVDKILNFDSKLEELNSMTPLFEISHIHRLIKSIIRGTASDRNLGESYFLDFISLRLQRSVSEKLEFSPTYSNCYQLKEDYQFIYLNYLKTQIENATQLNPSINNSCFKSDFFLNSSGKSFGEITIDLTDD